MTLSEAWRARLLLFLVAFGVFNGANDQTAIVVVLPAIVSEIGLAIDEFYLSSWIVNGYLLGYLVALPLVGRVADVFGHARVFAVTLVIFMIGSVMVALSNSFGWIVASRAVQAMGGGGVVPVSMAIVVSQLPREKRLMGLGAIAAAAEAGALIGPAWGGLITHWWGWRAVFWSNIPLVAPCVAGVWWLSHKEPPRDAGVDWLGAALLGSSLAILTYGLVNDPINPRPIGATFAILAVAAAFALAFIRREFAVEARGGEPLVRLAMLAAVRSAAANASMFLLGMGLITALMGIPLFVNLVLMEGALEGGMTLMRLTVAVPLGALAGGWVGARLGLRGTAFLGSLLVAAGFAGLHGWERDLSEAARTIPQLLSGLGFGLVLTPLGAAVMQGVGEGERATAAAWLTLSRMAGMLVGAALLTSHGLGRFYARAGALDFGSPRFMELVQEVQITTFREVFIAAGVVMVASALISLAIGRGEE